MANIKPKQNIQTYEIFFSVHNNKDHEPDWTEPDWGVCRICGLGRVREVAKDDERRSSGTGES